jgi:hypothetical protein
MSLLDTASLIVTPNGYKEGKLYSVIPSDGSGDLSVVRATTATRVNSAGLVELVPYNLFQYSEQFNNGAWVKSNATITANAITAPNGTLTADLIDYTGTGTAFCYQTLNLDAGVYKFSVYLKGVVGQRVILYIEKSGGTTAAQSCFLTSEWVRYELSITQASQSFVYVYLLFGEYVDPTERGDFYAWGAQLNEGTLKDYQKTETRLNIPRLDYSNGTCPSLLVEPQRTNLIFPSNGDNSMSFNGVFVANATTSPQGINNAFSFDVNNNSNGGVTTTTINTSAQPYTFSAYLKGSVNGQKVQLYGDLNGQIAIFTLTTEWVRYTATFTGAGFQSIYLLNGSYLSPAQNDLYYGYGMQLEVGSYATSYIPTTSASVTRNADVISKTGISSLIGQTEGTIFVEANVQSGYDGNNLFITLSDGTSSNMIFINRVGGRAEYYIESGGVMSAGFSMATILPNGVHKLAVAYKQNDFVFYVDGVLINTDTSGNVPAMSRINLGSYIAGSLPYNDGVKAAALWKTRLTNTQLAQLTTI